MKTKIILFLTFCLLVIMTGCASKKSVIPVSGDKVLTITAPIINVEGAKVGETVFTETAEGMTIDIVAEGLTPGLHGTHIHEKGECTPPDFKSAGGHFNPTSKEHGFKNPKGFHLGDLPNIDVDSTGKVNVSLKLTDITLKPGAENSILDSDGSALVIHEKADDNITDPAGDAGERIACSAITSDMLK